MSDIELTAIVAAITGAATAIAAALRWAVGRITRALDANTEAMRENAKASARLEVMIEQVSSWVEEHTPIGPAPTPPPKKQRARTSPLGTPTVTTYSIQRPKGGGEDPR